MSAQRAQRGTGDKGAAGAAPRRGANGASRSAPAPAPQVVPPSRPAARPPKPTERAVPSGARGGLARRTEGVRRLYAETAAEMKKINWPDRETTKNLTGVVIAISAVLGLLLGGIDFLLQALFEALP